MSNVINDRSYGVIPYRKIGENTYEVLLILHQSGHWHFPKGHAEIAETPLQAAKRELREEVGLGLWEVLNPDAPILETYTFRHDDTDIEKTVELYVATVIGEYLTIQEEEIADAKWLSPADADKLLTFDNSKATLKAALKLIK